uniref:Uncharacterized protein n=1 Tax=Rhizophora mucronata TaxID=61149 RepID=A0A2P2Q8D2_RHIMU
MSEPQWRSLFVNDEFVCQWVVIMYFSQLHFSYFLLLNEIIYNQSIFVV